MSRRRHTCRPCCCSLRRAGEGGKEHYRATSRRKRAYYPQSENKASGGSCCSVWSVSACSYARETAITPPLSHLHPTHNGCNKFATTKRLHTRTPKTTYILPTTKSRSRRPRSLALQSTSSHKELCAELPNLDSWRTKNSRKATPLYTVTLQSTMM